MNIDNLLDIKMVETFNPDLSNSPLNNKLKIKLYDKIMQMHCQKCFKVGYKVLICLCADDFLNVSLSDNVILLTIEGYNYEEIKSRLNIEDTIPIKLYRNIIINFILGNDENNFEQVLKIYKLFENYNDIIGVCINSKQNINFRLDIIAYK